MTPATRFQAPAPDRLHAASGARRGAVIAVVGCDGTGKSTLTVDLTMRLRCQQRAERRYLGLVSGEMGERIKQLPLIGRKLEHHLAGKAQLAQDMQLKLPGVTTACIMYLLSLWRAAHLRRVWRLARHGVLVITDRYPQAQIAGFRYDGPGLGAGRSKHWLVRKLAAREQRLYERMATHKPALVLRLAIDVATAQARKPDHGVAELRDKIATMQQLHFNGAPLVEIDTRAPYADVQEAAWRAIVSNVSAAASSSAATAAVPATDSRAAGKVPEASK